MMYLYHGSDVEIKIIELTKSQINKDFGKGFYLSSNLQQARNFARYKADKPNSKTKTPIVTKFEIAKYALIADKLRIKRFEGYSLEWVRFIKANRQRQNQEYDIIIGPIANDDVRTQFVKHMLGEITEEQLMQNLKYKKCTYQYCFVTQTAVDLLKTIGKI